MLKTSLLAIVLFLGSVSLFGQTNTFPASGNVGIGTSNPTYKLDVLGTSAFKSTSYFYNSTAYAYESSTDQYFHFKTNQGKGYLGMNSSNSIILQSNGGFVGIGITNPLHPFHFLSTADQRSRFQFGNTTIDLVDYSASTQGFSNSAGLFISGKDGLIMTSHGYHLKFVTNESGSFIERMRISKNGNIGIGTTNPTYKLAVNGTVGAHEINVTTTGWADYVFDDGYSLKTLEEVQEFYQSNGHLENIPTEKEVLENGVNLSEMTVKLLEKVEELTIYLVEQDVKIKAMQAELNALKASK